MSIKLGIHNLEKCIAHNPRITDRRRNSLYYDESKFFCTVQSRTWWHIQITSTSVTTFFFNLLLNFLFESTKFIIDFVSPVNLYNVYCLFHRMSKYSCGYDCGAEIRRSITGQTMRWPVFHAKKQAMEFGTVMTEKDEMRSGVWYAFSKLNGGTKHPREFQQLTTNI